MVAIVLHRSLHSNADWPRAHPDEFTVTPGIADYSRNSPLDLNAS